jgi:hypothetical protein
VLFLRFSHLGGANVDVLRNSAKFKRKKAFLTALFKFKLWLLLALNSFVVFQATAG